MPRAATLAVLIALGAPTVAAASEDRYGPPHPLDPGVASYGPAAAPASGWLNWSRKAAAPAPASSKASDVAEPPAPRPFEPAPLAAQAPQPDRIATASLPTSLYTAYPSARAEPAPPATLPQARWTPPPSRAAPPPQPSVAQNTAQPPRRYSVAREFGLTPDPIPLPQQFFSDGSADLAAPPPPLPPKPVPGTQAATSAANTASNRARQVALETADSAN